MDMSSINWLAVLVAGISAFVLGGVWYSPALFGNAWMSENRMTVEDVKKGNATKIYGIAFILSLLMAVNLAMYLADTPAECTGTVLKKPILPGGLLPGFFLVSGHFVVSLLLGYLNISQRGIYSLMEGTC